MADKLTARDCQIAALIASGLTYAEAGAQLKLSERTVKRVMSRPEVRAEVDAIRGRAVEAGLGMLCNDFTQAISDLRKLRQKGTPRDAVKLGAVKLTIESVLKVSENVTLRRDIEELRRLLDEPAGGTEPPKEDRGGAPGEPERGGERKRTEGRPDGSIREGGDDPGPVAGESPTGPLDAGITFGEPTGW